MKRSLSILLLLFLSGCAHRPSVDTAAGWFYACQERYEAQRDRWVCMHTTQAVLQELWR